METPPQHGDLEISEDYGFQRREWRWQSVGRWGLIAIIVAALAGLTGKGPLSRSHAESNDGACSVNYDRFLRNHDAATLQIQFRATTGESATPLVIDAAYLRGIRILRLEPQPTRELASSETHTWIFEHPPDATDLQVTVHFEPIGYGTLHGTIHAGGIEPVSIGQFVYP